MPLCPLLSFPQSWLLCPQVFFAEVVWFCRIFCLASKVFQVSPFISFEFAFILTSFSFALYFSFFITLILSEFKLPILSFGFLLTSMVLYNSYLVNQSLCYLLFRINIFSSVLLCISFTWVKFLLTVFFSSDSCWNLFLILLSWNPLYILFDISVCWYHASSCFDWCFCVCAELQLCFLLSRHLFYA